MERLPRQSEWLKPRDREKLFREITERSNWFRTQLAVATKSIRENYVPLLATGSLLMHDELEPLQRDHLRKMLAIQADVLSTIPPEGIGGISEIHQFIESEAEFERAQWRQLVVDKRLPQPWKNARKDAEALAGMITAAEDKR